MFADRAQHRRLVGHDAVNADVDQFLHFLGMIDGPDVNRESGPSSPFDAIARGDRHRALFHRDLEARRTRGDSSTQPREDLDRAGAGAHRRAESPTYSSQTTMTERTDADPIECTHRPKQSDQRFDRIVALGVDVDHCVGEFFEEVGEKGDGLTAVDEDPADLGPWHLADSTRSTGGASEIVVVERGKQAVRRQSNVGFQIAVTELDRVAECRKRVLGPFTRAPSVSERNETSGGMRFEVGMVVTGDDH